MIAHHLVDWLQHLRSKTADHHAHALTELFLQNLDLEAVNGIIGSVLRTEPERSRGLAQAVMRKTEGNSLLSRTWEYWNTTWER